MRLGMLLPDVQMADSTAALEIGAVCYDSRRVTPGSLFVAWRGTQRDGHAFIAQAVAQGCVAVLCERRMVALHVPHLVVNNVRYTMAQAARRFYGDPAAHMTLVGITGTNGKTSVAYLIEGMLRATPRQVGMIGTLGYRYTVGKARPATSAQLPSGEQPASTPLVPTGLTTPESVDLLALLAHMQQAGVAAVALEVSSQALAQQRAAGVAFDVAVFTNLTHDHLDYHKTLEAYFAAKATLLSHHLKPTGRGVLNVDDARVRTLATGAHVTFSATWPHSNAELTRAPDVFLKECRMGPQGTWLQAQTPRGTCTVDSLLLGEFNVANILAAIAVGEVLQLPLAAMASGIGAVTCVPGRLQRVSRPHEPLVVVDYAHTPDALGQALHTMRQLTSGRLFCVFGCGGERDPLKRPAMGRVAYHGADWTVVTNDNPRSEAAVSIAAEIVGGMQAAGGHACTEPSTDGYCVVLERACAIARAVGAATATDAVLIAGKGHEIYQIIGQISYDFDDRVQARQVLDALCANKKLF